MFNRFINRSKDYLTVLPHLEHKLIDAMKGTVTCLLYHRIEEYGKYPFLDLGGSPVTSPDDFQRELRYLANLPCEFYTLRDLNNGNFPNSEKIGIVICFDDCFKCNYEQGLEQLCRHDVPAVFFQCTNFIDQSSLIWEHLLYWLFHHSETREPFIASLGKRCDISDLKPEQLLDYYREKVDPNIIQQTAAELIDKNNMNDLIADLAKQIYPSSSQITHAAKLGHEIASHGHNHFKRETVSTEIFEKDLVQSSLALKNILGKSPESYSYPFNSYAPQDHDLVKRYFKNIATVDEKRIKQPVTLNQNIIPRFTWPGKSTNSYRMKRWLLTGSF